MDGLVAAAWRAWRGDVRSSLPRIFADWRG